MATESKQINVTNLSKAHIARLSGVRTFQLDEAELVEALYISKIPTACLL